MPRLSFQLFLLIAVLMCAIAIAFLIPIELRKSALEENGYIENATLFGYIFCIYLMMQKGGSEWIQARWRLVLIPLLLLAREADLHARFTVNSIFRTKYFFDSSESALAIAIAAVVVLFVIWVFASTAWKHAKWFFQNLWHLRPDALFIGIGLLFAIAAKTIDGTARKLSRYEITLNENGEMLALLIEETLELGIPLAFCLAVLNHFHRLSAENTAAISKSEQLYTPS